MPGPSDGTDSADAVDVGVGVPVGVGVSVEEVSASVGVGVSVDEVSVGEVSVGEGLGVGVPDGAEVGAAAVHVMTVDCGLAGLLDAELLDAGLVDAAAGVVGSAVAVGDAGGTRAAADVLVPICAEEVVGGVVPPTVPGGPFDVPSGAFEVAADRVAGPAGLADDGGPPVVTDGGGVGSATSTRPGDGTNPDPVGSGTLQAFRPPAGAATDPGDDEVPAQ